MSVGVISESRLRGKIKRIDSECVRAPTRALSPIQSIGMLIEY